VILYITTTVKNNINDTDDIMRRYCITDLCHVAGNNGDLKTWRRWNAEQFKAVGRLAGSGGEKNTDAPSTKKKNTKKIQTNFRQRWRVTGGSGGGGGGGGAPTAVEV